ncbi:hypothetical protein EJ04DRAFT_533010 [Polyplosphaeria fusca]|uniref:Organic solute transporter Ostalpha-domain-containing protein n=1 Tax=Polyplosphaeria fusca TaxID=682080 RepID=A0A9P4R663_9PLEO|nr:hypothetical protein EJ04DRAFT_533010 [Polyplosphaeria fusca]
MDAFLVARKLFGNDDDSNDKKVCPAPDESGPTIVPLFGDMYFHTFAMILAGACGVVSLLITLFACSQHAFHYSNPVQQRQVIRVLFLIPYVSFFSFLIVWLESAGPYLEESLDFGCAFALAAFLLLLCDYVMAQPDGFDALFGEGALKRGQYTPDSPPWLKRTWYSVLQYIPSAAIIWLATIISNAVGTYCATSNSPHFAHIWITVFKLIVTIIAIMAVLRFEKRMKSKFAEQRVMLKFFGFKGIIGLNVLQVTIINLLVSSDTVKPTSHLSYENIVSALPSLILACEMPIFAVLLLFAFPVGPYKNRKPSAGPFKAVVDALNYTDILSAFFRGPMRLVREQQKHLDRADSIALIPSGPPQYEEAMTYQERRY